MFRFKRHFRTLIGDEIRLRIQERIPEDREHGWVPVYRYNIYLNRPRIVIGYIDIRIGETENIYYAGHIGYRIYEPFRGHHYAAAACQLVRTVGLAHGYKEMIITCNPDNMPSRKTCERVGGTLIEIVDIPPHIEFYREGERQKCRYLWRLQD